jgi:hypothetical protein
LCILTDASRLVFPETSSLMTVMPVSAPLPVNPGVVKTGATGVVITGPRVVVVAFAVVDVDEEVQPAVQHPATRSAIITRRGRYCFIQPASVTAVV